MEQLSGLDAAFVYLDARNAPMHVGGLHVYQPSQGRFGFEEFRAHIAACIDRSPIFRRRLQQVPLRLGRPFWIDDPHFDLDLHLQHSALPAPGNWEALRELAARMFSRPLDPERPLWHLTFVAGLEHCGSFPPGSFAVISRVHHAAADGLGTLDMFNAIWSHQPQRLKARRHRARPRPPRPPGALKLLRKSLGGVFREPGDTLGWAAGVLRGGLGVGREFIAREHHAPPMLFQAPRSPFNVPISSRRVFDAANLPLEQVRAIRAAVPGATVNDVVLAACSGGLQRYLGDYGNLPERDLIAMAPISVRNQVNKGGNRVSAMLVPLELKAKDPLERLRRIHEHAVDSKAYTEAIGAATLADTSRFVPYSLATAAAGLYSGLHLARYHRPPFNLVITNVPGPREPLYLGTAKLLEGYGTAPVLDGLGLILVVTSYLDTLTVSATAANEAVPDVERLIEGVRASFAELHAAIGKRKPVPRAKRRRADAAG
ncbi:wax ester/triacylglycerol synthase family O-acyltransferase [Thioalkalivibrio sp. XN8]|uniref:WS/DGAT/MGAT family O-acyltransferase n=1 Tax=Thioalkalivibrio sp. XN8 TaxID=2712863 RepID=UPI0013E9CC77|nr:wax ester/triacylglycerol synthase family O-acyltransferase [Thioalkalivibrio sp. XN8]NGP54389.1 wax ester/triacylglycerol synthase family O-acyltransferase [Thioalkalivibrio sp. XN8]